MNAGLASGGIVDDVDAESEIGSKVIIADGVERGIDPHIEGLKTMFPTGTGFKDFEPG